MLIQHHSMKLSHAEPDKQSFVPQLVKSHFPGVNWTLGDFSWHSLWFAT
jgi:hypothetical protein